MEQTREAQPILQSFERDTLDPKNPTTAEITIPDTIIPGYDEEAEHENQQEERPKTEEEQLHETIKSELVALDTYLSFKVKNDIVAQIYVNSNSGSDKGINIDKVQTLVAKELAAEKQRVINQAENVYDTIPQAAIVPKNTFKSIHSYWEKDVDNLQRRMDVYHGVLEYIKSVESAGEDGLRDFTEEYIQRTHLEARDDVISILAHEKQELENENRRNKSEIADLENKIGALEAEVEEAIEQVEDRDMELLDNEVIAHLEAVAKDLAR